MFSQVPVLVQPRGNKRILVVLGLVGLFAGAALVVGLAYRRSSLHKMDGLEGTWHFANEPRHSYEFRPNGDVDTWSGSKEWWNRIGWTATWRRDGDQITIRTDRNWDFVGRLEGDFIRGKMIMRNPQTGEIESEIDLVWQKE